MAKEARNGGAAVSGPAGAAGASRGAPPPGLSYLARTQVPSSLTTYRE